jgi:Ran GTPase-activating protein (RanGAP) involved in mRNA processing and transport
LDEQGALSIVKAARHNNTLTSLGLSSCKMGTPGAKYLAEYIKPGRGGAALATLNLEYNDIDAEGVALIASALPGSALTDLNLCEVNRKHDERDNMSGIIAIAGALRAKNALSALNLSANDIDTEAGRLLADALQGNATLRKLDISCNRIAGVWREPGRMNLSGTYNGACLRALVEALGAKTCALTDLSLRSNELGVEAGEALAEWLTHGDCRLKRLDLQGNALGTTKEAVRQACKALRGLDASV